MTSIDKLLVKVELFDTYRGAGIAAGKKSLAFHLVFENPARTLKAEEAEEILGRIKTLLVQKFGAEIRD